MNWFAKNVGSVSLANKRFPNRHFRSRHLQGSSWCLSKMESSLHSLHNRNLLLRQPVQLVHQPIDLPVASINLPLEQLLGRRRLGVGELLVQGLRALDQVDHALVPHDVSAAGCGDGPGAVSLQM